MQLRNLQRLLRGVQPLLLLLLLLREGRRGLPPLLLLQPPLHALLQNYAQRQTLGGNLSSACPVCR